MEGENINRLINVGLIKFSCIMNPTDVFLKSGKNISLMNKILDEKKMEKKPIFEVCFEHCLIRERDCYVKKNEKELLFELTRHILVDLKRKEIDIRLRIIHEIFKGDDITVFDIKIPIEQLLDDGYLEFSAKPPSDLVRSQIDYCTVTLEFNCPSGSSFEANIFNCYCHLQSLLELDKLKDHSENVQSIISRFTKSDWNREIETALVMKKPDLLRWIKELGQNYRINESYDLSSFLISFNERYSMIFHYIQLCRIEDIYDEVCFRELLTFRNTDVNAIYFVDKKEMGIDSGIDWKMFTKKRTKMITPLQFCIAIFGDGKREVRSSIINNLLDFGCDIYCLRVPMVYVPLQRNKKFSTKHIEDIPLIPMHRGELNLMKTLIEKDPEFWANPKKMNEVAGYSFSTPLISSRSNMMSFRYLLSLDELVNPSTIAYSSSDPCLKKSAFSEIVYYGCIDKLQLILPKLDESHVYDTFTTGHGNDMDYPISKRLRKSSDFGHEIEVERQLFRIFRKNKQILGDCLFFGIMNEKLDEQIYDLLVKEFNAEMFFMIDQISKYHPHHLVNRLVRDGFLFLNQTKLSSVPSTIHHLVRSGDLKNVEKIVNDERISSNCYCYLNSEGNNVLHIAEEHSVLEFLLSKFPFLMFEKNKKGHYPHQVINIDRMENLSEFKEHVIHLESLIPSLQEFKYNIFELVFRIKGKNLDVHDLTGKSDPYFFIFAGNKRIYKSKIIKQNLNPNWGTIKITIDDIYWDTRTRFCMRLYDYDRFSSDDYMGELEFCINDFIESTKVKKTVINFEMLRKSSSNQKSSQVKKDFLYLNSGFVEMVLEEFKTSQKVIRHPKIAEINQIQTELIKKGV